MISARGFVHSPFPKYSNEERSRRDTAVKSSGRTSESWFGRSWFKATDMELPPGNAERYRSCMNWLEAAAWGCAGGAAAALISMASMIASAGYRWPRHLSEHGIWPQLFVVAVGLLVGGVVAAAAHAQMTGAWPALIMGACAPSVMRNILAQVEVSERKVAAYQEPEHEPV